MADDDKVLMVHPVASPDVAVEVTQHEFDSVWKAVGWEIQPPRKESK